MEQNGDTAYAFRSSATGEVHLLGKAPPMWELHLAADPAFTRQGWGRKVRDVGGRYSEARGMTSLRFVHVPSTETALINQLVERFHIDDKKALVALARGLPHGLPVQVCFRVGSPRRVRDVAGSLLRRWQRQMDACASDPTSNVLRWDSGLEKRQAVQRAAEAACARREALADTVGALVPVLATLPHGMAQRVLGLLESGVKAASQASQDIPQCASYTRKLVLETLGSEDVQEFRGFVRGVARSASKLGAEHHKGITSK